jgi:hypothetical protein
MQEGAEPPQALSDNHKRSISVSLQLLDKGLCEWEHWIGGRPPSGVMYAQQDNLSPAATVFVANAANTPATNAVGWNSPSSRSGDPPNAL